jgi:hypothetical protein
MTATRSSAGRAKWRAMRSRALEVVTDNDQGLVVEYTIAFRPLPAIQVFRHVRYPLVKDILGPEYWEYIVTQVLNFGLPAPIDIQIEGSDSASAV